jgi:hypothetical protein
LVTAIRISRLRWAGHIVWIEDNLPCKKITLDKPEGRRRVGRANLRWMDGVMRDAETLKKTLKPKTNPTVLYSIRNNQWIQSQMSSIHIVMSTLFKTRFNIILLSTPHSSKKSLFSTFPTTLYAFVMCITHNTL